METQSRKDLEFDKVVDKFASFCLSEEGRKELHRLPLTNDRKELTRRQDVISGFLRLISSGMVKNPESFPDLGDFFDHLGDLRYSMDGLTIREAASFIKSACLFDKFTKSRLEDKLEITSICTLFQEGINPTLVHASEEILSTLEADGKVRETHPAIAALIRQRENAKSGRQHFVKEYVNAHREKIQNDQGAMRDGRMVVAVRADRNGKDDGFVTGSSQSGNTFFIEPFHLVELNNQVTLVEERILIETAKILKQLADMLRNSKDAFFQLRDQVANADAFYALALSAHLFPLERADISSSSLNLLECRHPLLGKKAVPISITLEEGIKAVVLTGPNAGGKTVTIKTVALVAMINQLAGYIPCKEGSSLPLFDNVYTEIGDDQSIEEGLSTFSSHMARLAFILSHQTKDSLVVLDELGSGTDPVEGSALARSILEYCLQTGCLTLVTSHHGVLKEFAYAREDVMNASMTFDDQNHTPTFHVIQGVPGDSHALDTATSMHLPSCVVSRAREFLGSSAVQIGEIIQGLEKKRAELETQGKELDEEKEAFQRRETDLKERERKLHEEKVRLMDEQDTELSRFMRQKSSELENLVRDLKNGEVTKEKTVRVKEYVTSLKDKKQQSDAWIESQQHKFVPKRDYKVGESVLCGKARRQGVIIEVRKGDNYMVAIGTMKMNLKGRELVPSHEEQPVYSVSYTGTTPPPVAVLDVRGLTLEETLHKVDLEIESCLVHGISSFSIIHGYGDGILSKGIGSYLKKHPSVTDYRFAMPEDGGMGKTYVML